MTVQWRCGVCDVPVWIPYEESSEIPNLDCSICGGAMIKGLLPRCPKCGSRNPDMTEGPCAFVD